MKFTLSHMNALLNRSYLRASCLWLLFLLSMFIASAEAQQIKLTEIYTVVGGTPAPSFEPSDTPEALVLRRDGSVVPVNKALDLREGDVVETGKSMAAQIVFEQGHRILVMPETRVRLGLEGLFLFVGEVINRARGVFHIETDFMTAGVQGTEFLVRASPNASQVDVIVSEGAVLCRSSEALWAPIRVAAAEHFSAVAKTAATAPKDGRRRRSLQRALPGQSASKLPARGAELARIQDLARQLGDRTY